MRKNAGDDLYTIFSKEIMTWLVSGEKLCKFESSLTLGVPNETEKFRPHL